MGYTDQARRFAEHNLANWRASGTRRVLVLDPHDYISFTEDYPRYFGADFDIEIVLVVELFADLIRQGRLTPSVPINRAITYHDPCRLNKRKGIWAEPREILRAIPGLPFHRRRPGDAVVVLLRRRGRAADRKARADRGDQREPAGQGRRSWRSTPWSAPAPGRSGRSAPPVRPQNIDVVDIHELLAESLGIAVGGSRVMTLAVDRLEAVVAALATVLGPEQILTSKADRYNRARVPAPFPVHRWAERLPDLAVLPTTTEQVAAVVRIANDLRVPVVPRDGGTGLTDGAVPLRGGIVVDVKRMNQIHEIDLVNRTVTVGTGINMLKLNEELARHGLIYPDDPASYPCSLVGGRIGTSGWSLIGARYGHTRDLVLSFDHRAADRRHPARRRRDRPQDHQELQRLSAQAPVHGSPGHARHRDQGDAEAVSQAGGGALAVLVLRQLRRRLRLHRRAGPGREWPRSPARCCSTSGRSRTCAATTRPTSRSPPTSGRWSAR